MTEMLTAEQKRLVEDNVSLARFLAHKRWEMAPGVLEHEELVSLAYQGLVDAARRWRTYSEDRGTSEEDIAAGTGFSIFSRQRIIGAILDWQKRDADHVPRSYRVDYKILQRAGYPDKVRNPAKLSHITGLPVDRIRMVTSAVERSPISFHEMVDDEGNVLTVEPRSDHNVENSALISSVGEAIAARMTRLSYMQQVVLSLRYFQNMDLQTIAVELGEPITIVKDAHNTAIEAVRSAMIEVVTA